MFLIVWEFRVHPGREAEFERRYGLEGDWTALFSRSAEYRGSELLRSRETPGRYLTIDRWTSRAAYEAFRAAWQAQYDALDRTCATLTADERILGGFETREARPGR